MHTNEKRLFLSTDSCTYPRPPQHQSIMTTAACTSSTTDRRTSSLSSSSQQIYSNDAGEMMIPLSKDYDPGPCDVIVYATRSLSSCGQQQQQQRPIQIKQHVGNRRYRAILQLALVKFARASTKFQKWHVVNQIVSLICCRTKNNNNNNNNNNSCNTQQYATTSTGAGSLLLFFVAQDDVTGRWYQVIGQKFVHEIVEDNLQQRLQRFQKRNAKRGGGGSSNPWNQFPTTVAIPFRPLGSPAVGRATASHSRP